uniref:Exonuclease domain-containing protein n=1 Tax=Bracon brevicornis TaxID=1563983 RepID=A0A6V7KJA8_9HYME
MYHNGKKVNAVLPTVGIENFINFLKSLDRPVILVAHNCFNFDGPLIVGLIDRIGELENFNNIVAGFSDSLPLLRKALPDRRKKGQGYRLMVLAQEYLGSCANAHNAVADTTMIENIVKLPSVDITANDFVDTRKSVADMRHKFICRVNDFKQSLRFF